MAGGPYYFSSASRAQLATCVPKLQRVLNEAIKYVDFKVVEGRRSVARQQALYAQGRTVRGPIVTNVDGVRKKGMHNYDPSRAVDIHPFLNGKPIAFSNHIYFAYTMGIILGVAESMGVKLRWGNDWNRDDDFSDGWDWPHLEVIDGA